ncbi:hypothetical protein [Geochorda subterranea]|uniref:Uncharacterized protein n=1 Tax=Geochorda subterranea TaxID=3109564 RepID=A0ABZ1BNM4_9FIRM|nr:hypothetical protein [Limnochorda sp. LNt]WRP14083.1 hypothetical protein VLY81_11725 [Limnochorda sp. LNt]
MSLATLIVVLMWSILVGLLVWAMTAGRKAAAASSYKLQARLVQLAPRVQAGAPPSDGAATSSRVAAGDTVATAQGDSSKKPASSSPAA